MQSHLKHRLGSLKKGFPSEVQFAPSLRQSGLNRVSETGPLSGALGNPPPPFGYVHASPLLCTCCASCSRASTASNAFESPGQRLRSFTLSAVGLELQRRISHDT